MAKSKLEIQVKTWRDLKESRGEWIALKVKERVLNNADIALRQRNQTDIKVTVAADFDECLVGGELQKATAAYTEAALEMRRLGANVQKLFIIESVCKMKFNIFMAAISLTGVDLMRVQAKLREVRRRLKETKKDVQVR